MTDEYYKIWVDIDKCDHPRMFDIKKNIAEACIPKIKLYMDAYAAGTQHEFVNDIQGYKRGTLHNSLNHLLSRIRLYGRVGDMEMWDPQDIHFKGAKAETFKREVLVEWWENICDICDLLDHDNYMQCTNLLYEYIFPGFERVFPELQQRGMNDHMVELFLSLAKIFRGHTVPYLDQLHRLWRGIDSEVRTAIENRIRVDRLVQGYGKSLDRMYYALEHPQEPRNAAGFGYD